MSQVSRQVSRNVLQHRLDAKEAEVRVLFDRLKRLWRECDLIEAKLKELDEQDGGD